MSSNRPVWGMCRGRQRWGYDEMEFLALLTWLVLAGTGVILLPFAITTPGAGLAGLAALGGLTASVLFIALGAPDWASWTQVGMALFGILAGTVAAMWLCDGQNISGARGEVLQAEVIGLQLPLYAVVTFISLLVAVHATEPII